MALYAIARDKEIRNWLRIFCAGSMRISPCAALGRTPMSRPSSRSRDIGESPLGARIHLPCLLCAFRCAWPDMCKFRLRVLILHSEVNIPTNRLFHWLDSYGNIPLCFKMDSIMDGRSLANHAVFNPQRLQSCQPKWLGKDGIRTIPFEEKYVVGQNVTSYADDE